MGSYGTNVLSGDYILNSNTPNAAVSPPDASVGGEEFILVNPLGVSPSYDVFNFLSGTEGC